MEEVFRISANGKVYSIYKGDKEDNYYILIKGYPHLIVTKDLNVLKKRAQYLIEVFDK